MFGSEKIQKPYMGQIQAFRVQGDTTNLHGSDIKHRNYIKIELKNQSVSRDLNRDWTHDEETIAEFYMSENQWASFISSMNLGGATPCTFALKPTGGVERVDPPEGKTPYQRAMEEVSDTTLEAISKIREVESEFQALSESKGAISKTEFKRLVGKLNTAAQHAESNLPFVGECVKRDIDKNVTSAKQDLEGFVLNMAQSLGLESIRNQTPQLGYESTGNEDEENE